MTAQVLEACPRKRAPEATMLRQFALETMQHNNRSDSHWHAPRVMASRLSRQPCTSWATLSENMQMAGISCGSRRTSTMWYCAAEAVLFERHAVRRAVFQVAPASEGVGTLPANCVLAMHASTAVITRHHCSRAADVRSTQPVRGIFRDF